MSRRMIVALAGLVALVTVRAPAPRASAPDPELAAPEAGSDFCLDDAPPGGPAAAAAPRPATDPPAKAAPEPVNVLDDKWPPGALGGEYEPVRTIHDPFPTFDGLAVDTVNGRVVMSDENRHSLLAYDLAAAGSADKVTEPARQVFGPSTRLGFAAGVAVDPQRKEMYTVNNDGGDALLAYPYDAHGNAAPARVLTVPHQSWGVALSQEKDEVVLTVQQSNSIVFYPRGAKGLERPRRTIAGMKTLLHDPHGIVYDAAHNEVVVANHGNWTKVRPYTLYDPLVTNEPYEPGRFHPPALTVHAADADGDAAPLRRIVGERTKLNWPMGIAYDAAHAEIAVANYGDSSILFFARTATGDAAPVRVLRGALTGILGPVGVGIDTSKDELWVANYGDHTAVVFPRTAAGNVKPARVVRNAPPETPTCGFTNVSAAAFDSKRGAILVPN